MFDLRSLEHSTILYETLSKPAATPNATSTESPPLLRLAWNKQDSNYIATFQVDSASVLILDVRVPAVPVAELSGHVGPINAIGWAPHSSGHLCSAGTFSVLFTHRRRWTSAHLGRFTNIKDQIHSRPHSGVLCRFRSQPVCLVNACSRVGFYCVWKYCTGASSVDTRFYFF